MTTQSQGRNKAAPAVLIGPGGEYCHDPLAGPDGTPAAPAGPTRADLLIAAGVAFVAGVLVGVLLGRGGL